jgi:hypothetical protein
VLSDWDLFGHLRYLKKPVEMFVVRDVELANDNSHSGCGVLASAEVTRLAVGAPDGSAIGRSQEGRAVAASKRRRSR